MKKILTLIQVIDNLSRMNRTGGVLFSGLNPNYGDSLADHSYKTTYIALLMGRIAVKNGKEINIEKLLVSALTHDWSEAIILDVPSGSPSYQTYFENTNIREVMKVAEKKAIDKMKEYIREDADIELQNGELNKDESNILKLSDIIAFLLEILEWKYQSLKYEWFNYVWANTYKKAIDIANDDLQFILPLLEEMQKQFDNPSKPANPFLTLPEYQNYKK